MEQFVIEVFVQEIITQCEFAKIAMADLRAALRTHNTRRVFYSAHAFLVAVGNISKILWPGAQHKRRGDELRRVLRVPVNSPIKARDFRNFYEHYDERLDKWVASSKSKNLADMNIMGPNGIVGLDPEDFMRNLDPTNLNLTFRGDTYDLLAAEGALNSILNEANSF